MAKLQTPLTPAVFHILLALRSGDLHGYGIMKQVEADSEARVKMGPGTLYGSLKRMLDAGLVEECGGPASEQGSDERRQYYRLSTKGQGALQAELQRYRDVVTLTNGLARAIQ